MFYAVLHNGELPTDDLHRKAVLRASKGLLRLLVGLPWVMSKVRFTGLCVRLSGYR